VRQPASRLAPSTPLDLTYRALAVASPQHLVLTIRG